MKKSNRNILIVIGIAIAIILLLIYGENNGFLSVTNGTGSGGGGGGGGGSDGNTITDPCHQTAIDNGYSNYKNPIGTQLACSTLAFSDCSSKSKLFDTGKFFDSIDCCIWNCKDKPAESPLCSDSDSGFDIWKYGVVNVPRLTIMYPDRCLDGRYLQEWHCDTNGVAVVDTVDCFMNGAICHAGACTKPTCGQIINPQDQDDCTLGTGCSSSEFCKFIPAESFSASRCQCTVPTDCNSFCMKDGYSSGYCYAGLLSRNPCGTNTHVFAYDSYCSRPLEGLPTCCCR